MASLTAAFVCGQERDAEQLFESNDKADICYQCHLGAASGGLLKVF